MKIMGVDIDSRKFGISFFEDSKFISSIFFASKEKSIDDRLYEIYFKLDEILEKNKIDKVFIEKTFRTSNALSESIGNFKMLCRLKKIPVETVHNKTWKKEIIGNGNCSKEDILEFVRSHYSKIGEDCPQDVADAICITLYGVRNELSRQTFI